MEPSHQKTIATLFLSMSKEDYQSSCLECLRIVLECFRNDLKLILRISSKSFLKLSSTSKVFFDYFFQKLLSQSLKVFFSENLIQVFQKRLQEPHPLKATFPMLVTEAGMLMLFKDLHSAKALSPMLVTESGMSMLSKETHSAKVQYSMPVTESGMLMLFKDLHSAKELSPMLVTESGMSMLSKETHSAKVQYSMPVTESGMLMLSKDLHSAKALPPMLV